jgi:hypothetical protein
MALVVAPATPIAAAPRMKSRRSIDLLVEPALSSFSVRMVTSPVVLD